MTRTQPPVYCNRKFGICGESLHHSSSLLLLSQVSISGCREVVHIAKVLMRTIYACFLVFAAFFGERAVSFLVPGGPMTSAFCRPLRKQAYSVTVLSPFIPYSYCMYPSLSTIYQEEARMMRLVDSVPGILFTSVACINETLSYNKDCMLGSLVQAILRIRKM